MRIKTRLKVDLGILRRNFTKMRTMVKGNQVLFMVKSNAYGHGLVPIVRFAVEELGIKEFGCATLGEALTLRKELSDLEYDLYVFSDLELHSTNGIRHYLDNRIMPVLSSMEGLRTVLSHPECRFVPLSLKLDTGMNRLGLKEEEIPEAIEAIKKAGRTRIHHLMSHFACSSQAVRKNSPNIRQYEKFKQMKAQFSAAGLVLERTSMANSGAIEQGLALEESHVRPGLLLYGPSSLVPSLRRAGKWQGESISSLESHIIHLKKVRKGDPIGYGATPCPRAGILAYVALGYGDGITNFYRGIKIRHQGMEGEVVGRISMDMMAVCFPLEAQEKLRLEDSVVLWDHDPGTVLALAEKISSIPYEVYCGLSDRIPRSYVLS